MIEIKHRLTGKVLRTVDADTLAGAELSGANLAGAYLFGANLCRANLSLAYLACANLVGANLSRADLSCATLVRADLFGANLTGANLAEAIVGRGYICNGGYVAYPEIGSRRDTLHVFSTDQGPCVRTGCFSGSLDEFAAAVEKTHAYNSGHRGDYRRVIAEIKETLK